MSIAVMALVWKQSIHKGNALLLLLAIADNAADDGYAWPGTRYLAEKTRASRQTVMRLTKTLEKSGELYVTHSRRIGNKYIVLTGMNSQEISAVLEGRFKYEPKKISDILICNKMLHLMSQNVTSDVTPVLPEPSLIVKESPVPLMPKLKSPKPPPSASRLMFSALASICQIDLTTITGTQRKQLNQSEKILRKADATPADMESFAAWWYANDWRGKKGDAPRPAQVRETWGKFKAWKDKQAAAPSSGFRDLTAQRLSAMG